MPMTSRVSRPLRMSTKPLLERRRRRTLRSFIVLDHPRSPCALGMRWVLFTCFSAALWPAALFPCRTAKTRGTPRVGAMCLFTMVEKSADLAHDQGRFGAAKAEAVGKRHVDLFLECRLGHQIDRGFDRRIIEIEGRRGDAVTHGEQA